ncbi:MAG TPA: HAD-IC family P-type ATPase, partial [Elusimicrobiota bacterium]|nr:HAD-IC family P-type ATPase [Elusimicrobiota bacterium]
MTVAAETPAAGASSASERAARAAQGESRLLRCAAQPVEAAIAALETGERGLDEAEVASRLEEFGPNTPGGVPKPSAAAQILERFKNPLALQLLAIAAVSLLLGDPRAAIMVGIMLLLSVVLGYVQEARSDKAAERLLSMVKIRCTVLRAGKQVELPMAALVPGDVVVLNAGSIIPADLRLISAKDFFVSQSALTGESMPVEKSAGPCESAGKGALELPNICFQGSNALSGAARGVVVNTGTSTYFGAISQKLAAQRIQTSFDRGIDSFTWLMVRFMIVMVSVVFLIVGLTKGNWGEALLFGLSVAVGLTPEMLPMIVTVNLSKGALAMSRKKVIVKRLHSIQNFGAMDVLCTDKTGTLTQDRVVLERHVDVTNRPSDDVLRYAYMNSYYQTGLRNLIDRAILAHSDQEVERTCRKVDEIPFD